MAYLLWFMQGTGRCDRVKLCDILILIIIGNADSLVRVWWGENDMGVKWTRFMTTPGNHCNDY